MFKGLLLIAIAVPMFAQARTNCAGIREPVICSLSETHFTAEAYLKQLTSSIEKNESAEVICQKIGRVQGAMAAIDAVTIALPSSSEKGRPVYMEPIIGMQGFCDKKDLRKYSPSWLKYHDVAALKSAVAETEKNLEFVNERLIEEINEQTK